MNSEQFWQIVDHVRAAAGPGSERRVDELRIELEKRSPGELLAFQEHYEAAIRQSDHWNLIGAAYLMSRGGGVTDDRFRYFQDWLISEGKAVFLKAVTDADSLADADVAGDGEPSLEAYHYVASKVYKEKTGEAMLRKSSPELLFSAPAGEEWEYEELASLLPKLSRKYSG